MRRWKLKSRILAWMLVISMVVTILPVQQAAAAEQPVQQATAAEPGFQDVRPTDWFYDAVDYVQKNGIFSGTGVGAFSPQGTMTRAMYVTALGRMAGVDISEYTTSTFADVQSGIWYAPYVEWAAKKGITAGTGGRNFSPDATVSREQMAALNLRYFESYQIPYQTSNRVTTKPGDLADVSPWAVDAVVKMWQAGFFVGDDKGHFNPHVQASRAEAAVLFMRNNEVVQTWQNQNPATVTPTPKPESGGNSGGNSGGSSNNSEYTITFESNGGTVVTSQKVKYGFEAEEPEIPTKTGYTFGGWYSDSKLTISYSFTTTVTGNRTLYAKWMANYTVSFDSNGGSAVAARTVMEGEALSNLPAPVKEGYIFQGWFRDSDLSLIFASGSTVTADMKLYAKYMDNVSNAVQSIPSYSALDVAPDFTIAVYDETGSLTASEVQAGMKFDDIANPDSAGITVTGANGLFTVASAAEDGRFEEGNTYQLTLTDDNLSFQGQDATTSIYVFSVAKQEAMSISLNPNMIYLRFADVTDMMLDGADVGSPAIPVVRATVGGSDTGLAAANASGGTFTYSGGTVIQVGDAVAIYEGVRPDLRTVATTGADDGDIAYVKITAINGNTYTFGNADVKQVLFKPDVLPVSVEADTDGDPSNNSITVAHTAMNYSDSLYAPLGLDELTTVDVGDFIGFYEGDFGEEDLRTVGYGRITSITSAAEMDIITYTVATVEDIANSFNIYQKQAISGDVLLSDEQIAHLEAQIEQQAIASGFVDQAANYLSTLAMETKEFQKIQKVKAPSFLASGIGSRVSVENLTVVASLGTKLKNINGRTSGVSATLQVGADIVVNINEDSDLVIHMTGTFVQEMSLDLGVDSDTKWHWYTISTLFGDIPIFPVIDDYVVTANLDAYTYTGINITAKIATVEHDKLQDALDDWDKAATGGMLGKVRDITTEIQALIEGVQDTGVDEASLRAQYQEMMENETDWVPLIKKELVDKSQRVAFGIIEVNFTAEFVVKANVNLTIGADFNYTTAKRYSATLRVLSFTGSSGTVSLPGDGNYQFTFYVMGTLGLRAGINLELKAGIGSVDLNSIGLSIEPGAYVNLWGYFYYQKKQLNGVQTSRSLGALLVEIGIYLESAVGAQLGDGLLSASVPIYENTWPLYTVGEQQHVFDFAYSQDEAPTVNLAGSASSISLPQTLLTMSTFDLKTGEMNTQVYDRSRFDIQVDNRNFRYVAHTGKIEVVNKDIQVSEGNLVITWKGAPLSYTSDSLTRKIPLNWLARTGDYVFQLHPQNGGMTQIVAAPYNTEISVETPANPGYTFDSWYWTESGGSKATIPSRMPAADWHLYARWIPNTNTPYTVQHYLIDPNTKTSTSPVVTETLTGTTGTEIRITSDRFKDQGYATGTVKGVSIKGDGSTVVRIDYYPMNRTMTFDWAYAGAPASSLTEAVGKNIAARIPMPTRPGYTFARWSPNIPSTMPAADTAYTAQWTAKEDTPYQVVYLLQNIGSDTYTVADTESYSGTTDTMAKLTNPTKTYEGFTFDSNVPGTVTEALIAGKGTTVLKLYYKRNNYAMTINYNGSGEATKVVNVPFGATTELYLGAPTWQGHAFTGWSPALTTMPAQAVEFTAEWTLNTHTVSFISNGGSAVTSQTVGYGSQASKPAEPTKDDLVFGGWYSDGTLTTAYDFSSQVTADLTLYAKWLRSYTVSFDSDEGSAVTDQKVNEGDKATAPGAPTKEGYVFGGWYRDSSLTVAYDFEAETVTADLILYAKWTVAPKIYYTVSFNSNGGTIVDNLTVVEGSVATAPGVPTLIGHTFEGWYTDSALTSASRFNFSTTPIMANLTLYAKWTMNSYTVIFNSNGGSTVANQTVVYDGTATMPAAPTRNGYTFVGWYSDASLTTAYSFSTQVRSSITLYAKWTAVHTVSFNSNGGSSVADQTVANGGNATAPEAPTKDGHTFGGWYIDAGLNEAYSFTTPVTGSLTLYAKWSFNSFTVSFETNGGPAVASQTVVPGERAVAPTTPKWVGYRFGGWYSDEELENVYDFSAAVTEDITLYAKWTMTSWLELGDTIETGVSKQSKVVADSHGTPYVAVMTQNNQVFVKKYVEATDEWQIVGGPDTFPEAWNSSVEVTLAIDSRDMLYVAYVARVGTSWETVVYRYNGGAWEPVGGKITHFGSEPSIVFDKNDTPYLAYKDAITTYHTIYVMRLKDGQWESIDSMFVGYSNNLAVAIGDNAQGEDTLYLYYTYDVINGAPAAAAVKYEGVNFGTETSLNPPAPAGRRGVSFKLDPSGVPYIVNSKDNKVTVLNYVGNAWVPVGTADFPIITHGGISNVDITFDSQGNPYVAYLDSSLGNRVTVMKYDNNTWSVVEHAGISAADAGEIGWLEITSDRNDNIYVNYIIRPGANPVFGAKEIVMKYDPDLH